MNPYDKHQKRIEAEDAKMPEAMRNVLTCSDGTDALRCKLDVSRCAEYFDAVVAFAKASNRWDGPMGLRANLERLVSLDHGKAPILYKDFAPYSFEFSAGGFQGGLIFHGKHDGGGNGSAPTFSVNLEPVDGWSLHT